MNYWRKDIAAWRNATASMSYDEKGAYDELLNVYYSQEKPFPNDERAIFRLVGAQDRKEQDLIRKLLKSHFHLNDNELHNSRADLEIKSYRVYCENQRRRRLGIKK